MPWCKISINLFFKLSYQVNMNIAPNPSHLEAVEAYRLFRGRDATIDALMRARGFPLTP